MAEFQTKTDEQLQQALHATLGREKEALRLFRPMPHQIPFLKSKARFRILRGGNRCLGGEQLIYDPVLGIERRIDEIDEEFHVLSRDPETGELVTKRASAPFIKSYGALYRVRLSNGETLVTTLEHRVLNMDGTWISIGDAWRTKATLWYEKTLRTDHNARVSQSAYTVQPSGAQPSCEYSETAESSDEAFQRLASAQHLVCAQDGSSRQEPLACSELSTNCNSVSSQSHQTSSSRTSSEVLGSQATSPEPLDDESSLNHLASNDHEAPHKSPQAVSPTPHDSHWFPAISSSLRLKGIRTSSQSLPDAFALRENLTSASQPHRHTPRHLQFAELSSSDKAPLTCHLVGTQPFDQDWLAATSRLFLDVQSFDVQHDLQTIPGYLDGYSSSHDPYDEQLLLEEDTYQSSSPSQVDALTHTPSLCSLDDLACTEEYIQQQSLLLHPSNSSSHMEELVQAYVTEDHAYTTTPSQFPSFGQTPSRSLQESSADPRTLTPTAHDLEQFASSHPPRFELNNFLSNCIVSSITYLRDDFIFDITVEDFSNYHASTLTNANSGKSLTSMASTASAATGMPIYLNDTETLPYLFPRHRPRKIWLVGKSVSHIGQTLHRMLFTEDNGLRVIRDEHTKQWRSFNPNNEYDVAYKEKCKFADPFIPPRLIKPNGFGWEDKRLNHFSQVALRDGTMIYAFTSGGDAKQGDAVDLIHIDEDIDYADHVWEWAMRLADYNGFLTWSAYPHSTNDALRRFHTIAEEEIGKPTPIAEEFILRFDQNEFIDKDTRDQQLQVLLYSGDATYRARNLGEFTFDTSLVYPSFDQKIHTALIADEKKRDEVDRILRERGGEPPDDWTRYFIIDPGHSVCAGLFLAIPPLELGNYVVAYDEIYQRQSDATKMAEACSLKMAGHSFEDFIMDWHGGRQTPMGMSKTVMMIYRDAFQAHGLRCIVRGSNFMWGDDNVTAGIERVRGWLSLQQNNLPTLRLYLPRTPHLQKEFGLYSMRIRSGTVADDPVAQHNHLLDCARYSASANLKYIPPRRSLQQINPAYRAYVKEREAGKASRKHGGNFINLGPGTANA